MAAIPVCDWLDLLTEAEPTRHHNGPFDVLAASARPSGAIGRTRTHLTPRSAEPRGSLDCISGAVVGASPPSFFSALLPPLSPPPWPAIARRKRLRVAGDKRLPWSRLGRGWCLVAGGGLGSLRAGGQGRHRVLLRRLLVRSHGSQGEAGETYPAFRFPFSYVLSPGSHGFLVRSIVCSILFSLLWSFILGFALLHRFFEDLSFGLNNIRALPFPLFPRIISSDDRFFLRLHDLFLIDRIID